MKKHPKGILAFVLTAIVLIISTAYATMQGDLLQKRRDVFGPGIGGATSPYYDLLETDLGTLSSNPSSCTGGGAVSHQFLSAMSAACGATLSQPAFSDISGTATGAQLPAPTASTLGGTKSLATALHFFMTGISTGGVPSAGQPAFTDLSGSIAASQMPALTGDTTTSAGGVATTTGAVNGVTYPASPSTDTVPVVTAANTATYKAIANCLDSSGNHLNYNTSTHAFSCGTTSSGGGTLATPTLAGWSTCSTSSSSATCPTNAATPSTWAWQPGDILIVHLNNNGGSATCGPGWSPLSTVTNGAGAVMTRCWQRAAAEPSTVNAYSSASGTNFGGYLFDIRYTGAGVVDVDQDKSAGFGGLGSPVTLTAATTLRNNELALYFCGSNNASVTVTGTGITTVQSTGSEGISTSTQTTAGLLPTATCQTTGAAGNSTTTFTDTFYVH